MVQERVSDRSADKEENDRYRTCCSICHIKCGTVFLGAIEAVVAIIVLVTVVQQIMWKNQHMSTCNKNFLRDCLIFQFSHFNITLIFDYIVVLMMCCILISILFLMCGILSDTSCLILPHLAVQGLFLLFSLGYFILHAWSYFYGDLYTHSRQFMMQSLIERMWLAALLIVLAAFQTYLFSAVVRCSMYVSGIEEARRRRESAFERCSERVRLAKENGLWRTTSWGGGFQQYKGQYDETKPKKPSKKGFRVQWNFNQNVVVEDEEAPLRPDNVTPGQSSPPRPSASSRTQPTPPRISRTDDKSRTSIESTKDSKGVGDGLRDIIPLKAEPRPLGRRRSSQLSNLSEEVHLVQKEGRISHQPETKRIHSESPKKDRAPRQVVMQKITCGEGTKIHRDSPIRTMEMRPTTQVPYGNVRVDVESRKLEVQRPSTSSVKRTESEKKDTLHASHSTKTRAAPSSRPPLRTYKSVDSDESKPEPHTSPRREHRSHARRSSVEVEDVPVPTVTHHVRQHHRSPEKRREPQEPPVVKKISITSTSHPVF